MASMCLLEHVHARVYLCSAEVGNTLGVPCFKAVTASERVPISLGMGAGCSEAFQGPCAGLGEESLVRVQAAGR